VDPAVLQQMAEILVPAYACLTKGCSALAWGVEIAMAMPWGRAAKAADVGHATWVANKGGEALSVAGGLAHWGNPKTLADHFARHGKDFGAKSADDYARQASNFFRRSQADRLPTKIDADGVIRVYDLRSNTFGAFNPDGTTRTFFKPTSPTYFDSQPGSVPWSP
jgi:hypothetical protein